MSKLKLMALAIAAGVILPSFADRTLNDGLVAYLPFDNSMTENAVSGSPVAPEASTATAPTLANGGMVGKCLNIPSGAYVKLTGSDSVTLANNSLGFEDSNRSFTAIIWANHGALANDPVIFANKNWGGTAKGALLCAKTVSNKPTVQFNAGNNSSRIDSNATAMQFTGEGTGKWTFYAMVGTNGTFYCYQGKSDGTFNAKSPASLSNFDMDTGYPFVLGQQGDCAYGRIFTGQLDDFALWNRALSPADIQRIYEFGRSGAGLGELLKIDANDAPTMEVAKSGDDQYTFTFGGRRNGTHALYIAAATDDQGEDKYAWESFVKIDDIPASTNIYTYTVPLSYFEANKRIRFFLMQTAGLPYAKEVEYAHSDGTAWIDSGIAPRRELITEFNMRLTADNGSYQNFFGAFTVDGNKKSNYGMCRSNSKWDREYNTGVGSGSPYQFTGSCILNTDYHVVFTTTNLFVNGADTSGGGGMTLSQFVEGGTPTINIFRDEKLKSDGTFVTYDQTMVGYFKDFALYTPKHKVRDYVPVEDAGGTVGLFDRVTGQLQSSAGTALTAGEDLDATRYGWVRCVSEPYLASSTTPATAVYIGGGTNPLDLTDGANWACTNVFGFALPPDSVPTADTDVFVAGATTFAVAGDFAFVCKSIKFENVTFADGADLRGLDITKVTADSVIELQGRTLRIPGANGATAAFTINDSTSGTPGTVLWEVANGEVIESSAMLTGNLRLIKDDAGVLSLGSPSQTYTGGTDVTAGTVRLGAGGASCLGTGIVTVGSEATFDLNGKNASACTMILSGGTITSSANGAESTLPLHLTLTEDSRITFQNLSATHDMYMNGSEWNLGGKTLTLKLDGKDPDFYIQQTGNGVTTSTTTTISNGTFKVEVASTAVNGSNQGDHAWVHIANLNGKDGLNLDLGGSALRMELATKNSSVYGFTATPKFGDVKSTKTMEVYGTYLSASSYGFNMMMMDGSTVDLSQRTGSWNSRFSNTQDYQDKNTKVSFAANSTITVNLEGRTDLKTIAKSESPYIVTWATKPADTTTFVLDAATQELGFKCKVTDAGLRLMKTNGLVIIVK